MTRRARTLTREERELWALVARATVPLKGRIVPPLEAAPSPSAPVPPARVGPPAPGPRTKASPAPPIAPLVPLERRTMRQLARGQATAGAVMDLHGMTQAEAHGALVRFLVRAQANGQGLVLVVTGKGADMGAAGPDALSGGSGRGVLRRMVPHWLMLPDLRPIVLGFEEAGPRQGGGGALYIRLRRRRG